MRVRPRCDRPRSTPQPGVARVVPGYPAAGRGAGPQQRWNGRPFNAPWSLVEKHRPGRSTRPAGCYRPYQRPNQRPAKPKTKDDRRPSKTTDQRTRQPEPGRNTAQALHPGQTPRAPKQPPPTPATPARANPQGPPLPTVLPGCHRPRAARCRLRVEPQQSNAEAAGRSTRPGPQMPQVGRPHRPRVQWLLVPGSPPKRSGDSGEAK